MKVSEAVAGRRSIRAFLDKQVDLKQLREILEQAARAPSGGNIQPWHIHVVAGHKMKMFKQLIAERLQTNPKGEDPEFDVYPKNMEPVFKARVEDVGAQLYQTLGIPREDKARRLQWFKRNYEFFGAPVGLFCFLKRDHGAPQWGDAGMYLQTVMLLLREHGMESCPQECWVRYAKTIYEFLNIPADQILFTGMAIGWMDAQATANQFIAPRANADEFLHFHSAD